MQVSQNIHISGRHYLTEKPRTFPPPVHLHLRYLLFVSFSFFLFWGDQIDVDVVPGALEVEVAEVDVLVVVTEEVVLGALWTEVVKVEVLEVVTEEVVLGAMEVDVAEEDRLKVAVEEVVLGAMELVVAEVHVFDAVADDKINVGVASSSRFVCFCIRFSLLD